MWSKAASVFQKAPPSLRCRILNECVQEAKQPHMARAYAHHYQASSLQTRCSISPFSQRYGSIYAFNNVRKLLKAAIFFNLVRTSILMPHKSIFAANGAIFYFFGAFSVLVPHFLPPFFSTTYQHIPHFRSQRAEDISCFCPMYALESS